MKESKIYVGNYLAPTIRMSINGMCNINQVYRLDSNKVLDQRKVNWKQIS